MNHPHPLGYPGLTCDAEFWSLRLVEENAASYSVRKNVAQPPALLLDRGAMLTVFDRGGHGYAATCDLSPGGLQDALDRASRWARASAPRSLMGKRLPVDPAPRGEYASPAATSPAWGQREWYELLAAESARAGCDPR